MDASFFARLTRVFRATDYTSSNGLCPGGGEHTPVAPEGLMQLTDLDTKDTMDIHLCKHCQGLFFTKEKGDRGVPDSTA
jgi:hypothetical protein